MAATSCDSKTAVRMRRRMKRSIAINRMRTTGCDLQTAGLQRALYAFHRALAEVRKMRRREWEARTDGEIGEAPPRCFASLAAIAQLDALLKACVFFPMQRSHRQERRGLPVRRLQPGPRQERRPGAWHHPDRHRRRRTEARVCQATAHGHWQQGAGGCSLSSTSATLFAAVAVHFLEINIESRWYTNTAFWGPRQSHSLRQLNTI